eukprot:COSAG01_NODE_83_length_27807_cov_20.014581_7_plen_109_part_00
MGKGGGSDDEGEEQAADVRIDWMEARITNLGKYKPDKVLQMLATDESRNALIDFLDDDDAKGVIVHTDAKGELKAAPPGSVNVTNKKNIKVHTPGCYAARRSPSLCAP